MDFSAQEKRSAGKHQLSLKQGSTCIACRHGIAHKLPAGSEAAFDESEREFGPTAQRQN